MCWEIGPLINFQHSVIQHSKPNYLWTWNQQQFIKTLRNRDKNAYINERIDFLSHGLLWCMWIDFYCPRTRLDRRSVDHLVVMYNELKKKSSIHFQVGTIQHKVIKCIQNYVSVEGFEWHLLHGQLALSNFLIVLIIWISVYFEKEVHFWVAYESLGWPAKFL